MQDNGADQDFSLRGGPPSSDCKGKDAMAPNALANFVETENIVRFKAPLKAETDAAKRALLMQLLADEQEKHQAGLIAVKFGQNKQVSKK